MSNDGIEDIGESDGRHRKDVFDGTGETQMTGDTRVTGKTGVTGVT